jgi:hypothetical protein
MVLSRKSGAAVRKWDGRPFRILSFDPGGTTGVAFSYMEDDEFKFRSLQIGPHEHHQELWELLSNYAYGYDLPSLEIVCESFEYRNMSRKGLELISKEYIGIIKLFCSLHGIKLIFHTASAAKHFVTDDKIKALDLWTPGKPHAMDGMRHLLKHMVVGKGIREPITDKWLEM